jgi:CRP/FNR family transcriptional regulator, cyclic AMP receptor protein
MVETLLRDIPLFSCLGDEELTHLESVAVKRAYPKNTILISEGDKGDQLYVIRRGKIKVVVTDDSGRERVISLLGPGEHFGEMALIDGESRSATIVTTEPTQLLTIRREDFLKILTSHPDLMFSLLKVMTKKVRIATSMFESLAFDDVYARLVKLLMNLASPMGDQWVVEEKLTHQEIADRIGASREMVSRILKALSGGGYISTEKKRITVRKKLPSNF